MPHRRRRATARGDTKCDTLSGPAASPRAPAPSSTSRWCACRAELGIELEELYDGNCTGAGVISEHSMETADALNARNFAMAQRLDLPLINICSTCQGVQSMAQNRMQARTRSWPPRSTPALAEEGLFYDAEKRPRREELPLGAGRRLRPRPPQEHGQEAADRPQGRPLLRLLHPSPRVRPRLRRAPGPRQVPRVRHRGRWAATLDHLRRPGQVLRLPHPDDQQEELADHGREPPQSRPRKRAPTAWSRPARSATSTSTRSSPTRPSTPASTAWRCRSCTCPSSSAWRWASTPRSCASTVTSSRQARSCRS